MRVLGLQLGASTACISLKRRASQIGTRLVHRSRTTSKMKHWDCRFVCVNTNSWALECMAERARSVCLRDALRVARRESGGSARCTRRHGLCSHAHALPPLEWGADGWASEWASQREWTAGTMRMPTHAHSSDTAGVGGSERRDATQRYALSVTHSWGCRFASHRRVIPAHHGDGDMGTAMTMPVDGPREGVRSVCCRVRRRPSLSSPCTRTEQQRRRQDSNVSVSHGCGSCTHTSVGACCAAMGVLQRHVGVRSDRSPAALSLPLRHRDAGARRESHRDTLLISRACQWLHSQAAMCVHGCERDGRRHDWRIEETETRVPAFN